MDNLLGLLGLMFFMFLVLAAAVEVILEVFRGALEWIGIGWFKSTVSLDEALQLAKEFAPNNQELDTKLQAVKSSVNQINSTSNWIIRFLRWLGQPIKAWLLKDSNQNTSGAPVVASGAPAIMSNAPVVESDTPDLVRDARVVVSDAPAVTTVAPAVATVALAAMTLVASGTPAPVNTTPSFRFKEWLAHMLFPKDSLKENKEDLAKLENQLTTLKDNDPQRPIIAAKINAIALSVKTELEKNERLRIFWLRFIAAGVGCFLAYHSNFYIFQMLAEAPEAQVFLAKLPNLQAPWINIVVGGLAAAAGSSYWHDQLDKVRNLKASAQALKSQG